MNSTQLRTLENLLSGSGLKMVDVPPVAAQPVYLLDHTSDTDRRTRCFYLDKAHAHTRLDHLRDCSGGFGRVEAVTLESVLMRANLSLEAEDAPPVARKRR